MKKFSDIVREAGAKLIKYFVGLSLKGKIFYGVGCTMAIALVTGLGIWLSQPTEVKGEQTTTEVTDTDGNKTDVPSDIKPDEVAKEEDKTNPPSAPDTIEEIKVDPSKPDNVEPTIPDGEGGAKPNPEQPVNNKHIDEGQPEQQPSQPSTPPQQEQPQQPSTPDRESGDSITAYIKSCRTNSNTNNSDVESMYCICTPAFLNNAMGIINNFINGAIDEGTARAQIQALNGTGDCKDSYGWTLYTEIDSINVVNVSIPGSQGREGCHDATWDLNGGGVCNYKVTYNASSDSYLIKGIMIRATIQNR